MRARRELNLCVKPEPVARAISRFPDRDHVGVARDLEFWACDGNGTRRKIKNLHQTYYSFLRRAHPISNGNGRSATSKLSADLAHFDELKARLA